MLNDDGTEYVTGPRWRLLADKHSLDVPSAVIPTDPSLPWPTKEDDRKPATGAETQTVINLLDWASDDSPLSIGAGWQDGAGTVSINGMNMTNAFSCGVLC